MFPKIHQGLDTELLSETLPEAANEQHSHLTAVLSTEPRQSLVGQPGSIWVSNTAAKLSMGTKLAVGIKDGVSRNELKNSQIKVRVFLMWMLMLQSLVLHHDVVFGSTHISITESWNW